MFQRTVLQFYNYCLQFKNISTTRIVGRIVQMYTDLYEIITLIFLNFSIERKVKATQPCRLPYMFKVSNRNTRTRFEIRSKLTIKTPQRRQWRRCCVLLLI